MLQPVEASALIGNFIWESGGQLNPNEEGGGIGQWGGPRYTDLQKFGGTTGNQNPSFEAQVAFASHELLGTSSSDDFSVVLTDAETAIVDDGSNVLAQLNDVTEIFELQYECPSGSIGCDTSSATFEPPVNQKNDAWTSLPAREYYAIQIYDLFAGGNIPDPLPGILSSASCGGSGTTTTIA